MAINTTMLISLLDLEKCFSSNPMLKKMVSIWVGQLCVTRFVLKLCIFEAFISSMAAGQHSARLAEWPTSEPHEVEAQLALALEPSSASVPREQPTNPTPASGQLHLDDVPSTQRCRNCPQ